MLDRPGSVKQKNFNRTFLFVKSRFAAFHTKVPAARGDYVSPSVYKLVPRVDSHLN